MTTILDRIKLLIDTNARGRIAIFARKTGIADGTIRSWYRKKVEPKPDKVQKICNAFGVSSDWLLYGKGPNPQHLAIDSPDESSKVDHNKLNDENAFQSDNPNVSAHPGAMNLSGEIVTIPLIPHSEVVRAGYDKSKEWRNFVMVPKEYCHDPDAYAMKIIDDSMAPLYRQGDTIVASPALLPVQGRGAVVKILDQMRPVVRIWTRQEDGLALLKTCNHTEMDRAVKQSQIEFAHKIVIKIEGG